MSAPLFDFALWLAQADCEGYYVTRWDQATSVTVRAANKQEAINQAAAALGAPRRGRYWIARVKHVTAAAITDGANDALLSTDRQTQDGDR